MDEEKEPCKRCGVVHRIKVIEAMREKVAESMESGKCAWCGKTIGKEHMEEHVRMHVVIAKAQAEISELQGWLIAGKRD